MPPNFAATKGQLRQNILIRSAGIPLYRLGSTVISVPYPPPRILANSVPKAGTHLLSRVLDGLPHVAHSGYFLSHHTYAQPRLDTKQPDVDVQKLSSDLARVSPGQYAIAHLRFGPTVQQMLRWWRFSHIFIVRDPRDMAISLVNYILKRPRHALHKRFANHNNSEYDRLMAAIVGFWGDEYSSGLPSAGERIDHFAAWLDDPTVCVVRFEDLIGPYGGGSRALQTEAIFRIAEHVDRPLSTSEASNVGDKAFQTRSATFYKGVIGGWQAEFSSAHKEAFKQVAQGALEKLGYEEDANWL